MKARSGRGAPSGSLAGSSPPKASPRSPKERKSLRGVHVLVVDDNHTNRVILEQNLVGWSVRATRVQRCSRSPGGAVEGSGRQVTATNWPSLTITCRRWTASNSPARFASTRQLRSTKLVLLTSSARRGDARVARGSGIDGFLTKPVKTSALYDCLAAVLARAPTAATGADGHHLYPCRDQRCATPADACGRRQLGQPACGDPHAGEHGAPRGRREQWARGRGRGSERDAMRPS